MGWVDGVPIMDVPFAGHRGYRSRLSDYAGYSLAAPGDLNGDRVPDFVAGTCRFLAGGRVTAWSGASGESPVISSCLAAMNCRVVAAHKAGDHTLFIGEVEGITVGEGDPLVLFQRQFGGFSDQNSD